MVKASPCIAPRGRIYSLAVTDDTGAATAYGIVRGIDSAVRAHAQTIDVPVTTSTPRKALAKIVHKATGAPLIVARPAADGQAQAADGYPAAYSGVLSVAADWPDEVHPDSEAIDALVDLTALGKSVLGIGPGGGVCTGSGPTSRPGRLHSSRGTRGPWYLPNACSVLEATAVHPGIALPTTGASPHWYRMSSGPRLPLRQRRRAGSPSAGRLRPRPGTRPPMWPQSASVSLPSLRAAASGRAPRTFLAGRKTGRDAGVDRSPTGDDQQGLRWPTAWRMRSGRG